MGSLSWAEILYGLLSLIVLLIAAWSRSQDKRLEKLEDFQTDVYKNYVSKAEFNNLIKELKDALIRIEGKIEKLKG